METKEPRYFINRSKDHGPNQLSYTLLDGTTVAIAQAPRRLILAAFYLSMAITLLVFDSFITYMYFTGSLAVAPDNLKSVYFSIFGLVGLAWGFILGTRRAYSRPIDHHLKSDGRPPVFYLRSFADDTNDPEVGSASSGLGFSPLKTDEMKLSEYLGGIGPVVAIGRPGEYMPKLGAVRLYVEGHHWQAVASDLMDRARLVVVKAGHTPGLGWEYRRLFATERHEKILIWVPFRHGFWKSSRQAGYAPFRDWAEACVGRPFPPAIGDSSFLFVDPDGRLRLLDGQASFEAVYPRHPFLHLLTWMEQRGFLDVGKPFLPIDRPTRRKDRRSP